MRFLRDSDRRMHPGKESGKEEERRGRREKRNLTFRGFKRFRDSPRCFNVNLTSCTFPNTSRVDLDFSFAVPQTAFTHESGYKIRNGRQLREGFPSFVSSSWRNDVEFPTGSSLMLRYRHTATRRIFPGEIILDKNVRRCGKRIAFPQGVP